MASTLEHFAIPQRIFLAWMPSINKKCHQNHFLGVLEIIGCRLILFQGYAYRIMRQFHDMIMIQQCNLFEKSSQIYGGGGGGG